MLGPHTHTPAPTARGWQTPTARPVCGQSGEGERLTSDAPHNGGRHPPRGRPSATLTASNAGPQGRTLWDRCWLPRRPSQRLQASPPGGGPPPPPRHAAPTGYAGRGDSAGPPHPHACAHSMWVADPDGPPRGRATGGATAPDTRRPSQRWQANPPGTAPTTPAERRPHRACKPRGERRAPTPAHPRPQQEWMTDPDSPPRGRTVGGGGAPNRNRPSQRTRGPRNPGCLLLRNTGNTGHGDSAGPRTRTPVPTARGQRAPTAPRRRAAGGGRAPGLGRPSQRGCHGPRGGEHLVPTRTHECRPAEPAYELPHPRPAAPTARAPATENPQPTPCS